MKGVMLQVAGSSNIDEARTGILHYNGTNAK